MFGAVPEHELRKAGRRRRFDRGEVVFHRDDPGDSLHRVESGRFAARIITPLGDVATVGLHGPGDVFGLLAVVNPAQRRTATVVALEPAETLAIPASAFLRLRTDHPAVRDAVDQLLATWLSATTDRLVEALYTPAAARVRFHLVQLAALYGDLGRRGDHSAQPGSCGGPLGHDPRDGQPRAQTGTGTGGGEGRTRTYRRHTRAPARAPAARRERRRHAADEGPTVADPSSVGMKRRTSPTRTQFARPAQRTGPQPRWHAAGETGAAGSLRAVTARV